MPGRFTSPPPRWLRWLVQHVDSQIPDRAAGLTTTLQISFLVLLVLFSGFYGALAFGSWLGRTGAAPAQAVISGKTTYGWLGTTPTASRWFARWISAERPAQRQLATSRSPEPARRCSILRVHKSSACRIVCGSCAVAPNHRNDAATIPTRTGHTTPSCGFTARLYSALAR